MAITIDQAVAYLKADGDDNDLITGMLLQAQSVCEGYCNRKFYPTQDDCDADFSQALIDRTTQLAARTAQLATVTGQTADDMGTRAIIADRYLQVFAAITQRLNGIAMDGMTDAATYMTLGHLYVNREDNLATGNNVVQVPVGAQRILQPKLWIGDLITTDYDCDAFPNCGS